MKKLVLVSLIGLIVGCSNQAEQAGTASVGSKSLEGSYFDKKQRITITLKKVDDTTYQVDLKTLADSKNGQIAKAMTEKEVREFFTGMDFKYKAGQYFMLENSSCSSVIIQYENENDIDVASCIATIDHFVKQ